jgi:hypothetical protein
MTTLEIVKNKQTAADIVVDMEEDLRSAKYFAEAIRMMSLAVLVENGADPEGHALREVAGALIHRLEATTEHWEKVFKLTRG